MVLKDMELGGIAHEQPHLETNINAPGIDVNNNAGQMVYRGLLDKAAAIAKKSNLA